MGPGKKSLRIEYLEPDAFNLTAFPAMGVLTTFHFGSQALGLGKPFFPPGNVKDEVILYFLPADVTYKVPSFVTFQV